MRGLQKQLKTLRLVRLPVSVSATALLSQLPAHSRSQIKVVPPSALPTQVVVLLTDLVLGQGAEVIEEGLGVKKGQLCYDFVLRKVRWFAFQY